MLRFAWMPLLLGGCLFSNDISGDWSVGGQGGCTPGERVYVEVPDPNGPIVADRFACASGGFSIGVPEDMHDFALELWVEPAGGSGPDTGKARLELRDVVRDFDVGHVVFEPFAF